MLTALALSVLTAAIAFALGWHDGMRHDERLALLQGRAEKAARKNELWHDYAALLRTLPILLALSAASVLTRIAGDLAFFAYAPTFVACAAAWWIAFDLAHNLQQRQHPLYAGAVADTDEALEALPPAARLALKLLTLAGALALTYALR